LLDKENAMSEKRKLKRGYLLYHPRIFNVQTREPMRNLVDITPKGVLLVNEKTHPTDKPFLLSIEHSDDIADKPFLELTAKSIWCRPDVDPHFYTTGFELLDLTLQDREIIQRIIGRKKTATQTPSHRTSSKSRNGAPIRALKAQKKRPNSTS
jgi:hypothetical protein